MPKTNADAEKAKEINRLPYEKPFLKAVDLHAEEIMGSCQLTPTTCLVIGDPPESGPVSGTG